jgi:transcriptional regulator with XRE-family HTH domain
LYTQKFSYKSEVWRLKDVRISLREIIRDRGFRQAAIAGKAGMSPCKLSQVVNLERKLEANEMFALCNAMGITPVELSEYNTQISV